MKQQSTDVKIPNTRYDVYEFLKSQTVCALGTSDSNRVPHVASVHFFVDDELIIYFSTASKGRKYTNITNHPVVAMSITDNNKKQTVQLTGRAEIVSDIELENKVLTKLWRLQYKSESWPSPLIRIYERGGVEEIKVVKVVPTEMTYACFSSLPRAHKPYFQKII